MAVQVQPIEIAMADGVVLRGQRWGNGPDWIIFLHEPGDDRDLDDWRPLLPAIMADERTLVTVDLRGHGASDGEPDQGRFAKDLDAMLDHATASGAAWVALAGAGLSATELLRRAAERPVDALVLISPAMREEEAVSLRGRGEPKLFAVGSQSEPQNTSVRKARNRSIGWAMLVSLPTDVQGAALLQTRYAAQLTERVAAFLAEQRWIGRGRQGNQTPNVVSQDRTGKVR